MKIIENKIQCMHCNDIISSEHVHDYEICSCGVCACDGGLQYLRRQGKKDVDYIELSIMEENNKNITDNVIPFFRKDI